MKFLVGLLNKSDLQVHHLAIQSILSNILSANAGISQISNGGDGVAHLTCGITSEDSNGGDTYVHNKMTAKVDNLSCYENLQSSMLQNTTTSQCAGTNL